MARDSPNERHGVVALLEVKNLRTRFRTRTGDIRAVDGVSFEAHAGETLGLVGESGCGKSVTALSLMRLVPPAGEIADGQVWFDGVDLLSVSDATMHSIRGAKLAMIFQDPMTSLNPVLTIGRQVGKSLRLHLHLDRGAARRRTVELLEMVGIQTRATV